MSRLLARRQMRRAARLLASGAIGETDYAALILDGVARLDGKPLSRREGWRVGSFPVDLALALAGVGQVPTKVPGKYGPVEKVPGWMGRGFRVYIGTSDQWNEQTLVFQWGEASDQILRRARTRLRIWNRLYERADRWRAEQAAAAPHIQADVWKLVVTVIVAAAAFVAGRLTAE